MNCPHHCEILALAVGVIVIYQNDTQSLELFIAMNKVVNFISHTSEGFTQDDAHIFCTPDQLDHEFKAVIDLVLYVFNSLGFEDFTAQVSVRDPNSPDKYIGKVEDWDKAEQAIMNATQKRTQLCY